MRPGARIKAAADVLQVILDRHHPAAMALADWGRQHRFAGSSDRSAIGNIVYDALRRRSSFSAAMGIDPSSDTVATTDRARALALAAAPAALGLTPDEVITAANEDSPHTIGPLDAREHQALATWAPDGSTGSRPDLPPHVAADYPEKWHASLERTFGDDLVREMTAMAERAPVGLRVNTLKAERDKVMKALARHNPAPTRYAPDGITVPHPEGARRTPNVEAEPAHGRGWFEVQDEGSQIVAALSGASPRMQILDLCAGAGGKALALGAMLRNTGQIYAYDKDAAQMRPMFDRLKRAGVRNVQAIPPGDTAALAALEGRFDLVFIDAPCSGSGTWRRRPDAKWRLSEQNLEARIADQRAVLDSAVPLVRPGGRLVYVTCSVLAEENDDQADWFSQSYPQFTAIPWTQLWQQALGDTPPPSGNKSETTLLLTPGGHGTDGFFFAAFERAASPA